MAHKSIYTAVPFTPFVNFKDISCVNTIHSSCDLNLAREIRTVYRKMITKMRMDEKSLDNFTAAMQTLKQLVKKALEDKRAMMKENAKNRPILSLQEIMQLSSRASRRPTIPGSPGSSNPACKDSHVYTKMHSLTCTFFYNIKMCTFDYHTTFVSKKPLLISPAIL